VQGFNRASIQTGNKGDLLSVDFGMKEWNEHKPKEIVRKYREFVYETGAVDARPVKCSGAALSRLAGQDLTGQGKGAVIEQKIVDKERKKKYKVRRVDRFMYRTRYFSPSETTTPQAWFLPEAGFHRASRRWDHWIQRVRG
jgi:hypothetical protein